MDEDLGSILCGKRSGYWWVCDREGRLLGSLDSSLAACSDDPRELLAAQDTAAMAVEEDASLRDAVSAMLGSSARTVPVVDRDFRLVGELDLDMIEEAAGKGGTKI